MRISELAYELYKIDWDKRSSAERVKDSIRICYLNVGTDDYPYSKYLEETSCNYSSYVCYDEFMNTEYFCEDYMRALLNNKTLFTEYKKDLEETK